MSQRIWLVAFAFFALLAAGLRLWGSVSAPIMPHPDEFVFPVVRPLKLLSGDLNPHNFTYPTFHLYLLGLVYGLFFVVQKLLGAGWSRVEFAAYYIFWDSDALVFWARATSVAFAGATVVWVGALARRLYGPGLGLAAAALLALNVIHVRQAALASVDAALACWCLGAVWAAVRLCEREELRDYALAGLLVGLATEGYKPRRSDSQERSRHIPGKSTVSRHAREFGHKLCHPSRQEKSHRQAQTVARIKLKNKN